MVNVMKDLSKIIRSIANLSMKIFDNRENEMKFSFELRTPDQTNEKLIASSRKIPKSSSTTSEDTQLRLEAT